MSTGETLLINCKDLDSTDALARQLGRNLRGQEVIELVSDLGGGKTTFVRSLAAGMGSQDQVTSPTFTLSNVYETPKLTVYHFDFYRLLEPGIMREELAETMADPAGVTVIEWADVVKDVLPTSRLTISIVVTGETERRFELTAPKELKYLLEGLN